MRSCIAHGLPTHVVQELNVGNVGASLMCVAYILKAIHPWVFVQHGFGRRPVDWCRT